MKHIFINISPAVNLCSGRIVRIQALNEVPGKFIKIKISDVELKDGRQNCQWNEFVLEGNY